MQGYQMLPVRSLTPDPDNADRTMGDLEELSRSLLVRGFLVPLVVRNHPRGIPGQYMIVDGERRWRAAQLASFREVPCVCRGRMSRDDVLKAMVTIDMERKDATPVERAKRLGRMRDALGFTPAQICTATGLSGATVSYHLGLLMLDDESLARLERGEITAQVAHAAVAAFRQSQKTEGSGRKKPNDLILDDRKRHGKQTRASAPAPHFGPGHRLAGVARDRCKALGHPLLAYLPGKVACGPCWEIAIRADQDKYVFEGTPA